MTKAVSSILSLATGWLASLLVIDGMASENLSAEECRESGYVCIRVRNSTSIDFDRFTVRFVDHAEEFGELRAGETSAYRQAGRTYRYAYTEALSGSRWFVLQPIDFVGEQLLPPGIYTYEYAVNALSEPVQVDDRLLHGFLWTTLQADDSGA